MLSAVRESLGYLSSRQRAQYVVLVALRGLGAILDVFGIVLIGFLAGVGASQFAGGDTQISLMGVPLPMLDETGILVLVSATLGVFVVKAAYAILITRILTRFIAGIEAENATRIAASVLEGSLADAQRHAKAEVQFAATASAGNAFTNILYGFATICGEGVLLVLIAATFIAVDPVVALVVLAYFGVVIALIQFVIGHSLKRAGAASAEGSVGSTSVVNDSLDAFREITVLGVEAHFLARFTTVRARLARSTSDLAFLGGLPRYIVETALMLGVVALVAWLFLSGELASGMATLGVFLTGGVRIMGSVLPLQNALALIKSSTEQGRLAMAFLREWRTRGSVAPALEPTAQIPAAALGVTIESLGFSYPGADRPALDGLSIEIAPGQHVALIGPSGAGKTTLVDLLLGLAPAARGTVEIGGLAPAALRTAAPGAVAYVPQRPGLVTGSIAENVALGLDDIDAARVREVLADVHLLDWVDTLPEGVHTSVGKQANALSGGQIQRLGLARALYRRPRLLVLDEATSALDAASESLVAETLRALGDAVTVIVIAHRLSTVQHADRVHLVEAGRIVASGTFAELRRDVPTVAEYVRLMSFEDPAS